MSHPRSTERVDFRAGPARTTSGPDLDATIRKAQRPGNQGVALTPEAYSTVLRAMMSGDARR